MPGKRAGSFCRAPVRRSLGLVDANATQTALSSGLLCSGSVTESSRKTPSAEICSCVLGAGKVEYVKSGEMIPEKLPETVPKRICRCSLKVMVEPVTCLPYS